MNKNRIFVGLLAVFALFATLYTPVSPVSEVFPVEAAGVSCTFRTIDNRTQINYGSEVTLTWTCTGATEVTLNGSAVASSGTFTEIITVNKSYVLFATDGNFPITNTINIVCLTPAPTCILSAAPQSIVVGDSSTLTWSTTDAASVSIDNGVGSSLGLNDSASVSPGATTTYTMTVVGIDNSTITCTETVTVTPVVPTAPTCSLFTATPNPITLGGISTLSWNQTNGRSATIDDGTGPVAVSLAGPYGVSPVVDTTYTLTVTGDPGTSPAVCTEMVTVTPVVPPSVSCDYIDASPRTINPGDSTTLRWSTSNATSVSIDNSIGAVSASSTAVVSPATSTTYTLTALGVGGPAVCAVPVTVTVPTAFSCANNVSFTASDSSIRRGDSTTLTWSTTGADTVSISEINATTLSGSASVAPSSDTTYVLTATKSGYAPIACPLAISVSSGGGGGGSATPRCELTISDKKISRGEEVTIKWDTSNAREVTLFNENDEILFTTDKYLSTEKSKYYDWYFDVTPTKDTTYTLLAERGSRDRECKVSVDVVDGVTVLQTRNQQPLVAGISLTSVPYTGFEAGPFLTIFFYALIAAWALYLAYLIVLRKRIREAAVLVDVPASSLPGKSYEGTVATTQAESINPEVFVQSVTTTRAPADEAIAAGVPHNLPTTDAVVGYENDPSVAVLEGTDLIVTEIENYAHAKRALLSSEAIQHLIAVTDEENRYQTLDAIIDEIKQYYPLEDGWLIVNEERILAHCVSEEGASEAPEQPVVLMSEGAGSLAEAIVTGNVVAAYGMIGHRPMFSLADAAADLDAVYRNRQGKSEPVSDLLLAETARLSDEQIKKMIAALSGALDGTYTSEEEAVKMAIMKAVKAAA